MRPVYVQPNLPTAKIMEIHPLRDLVLSLEEIITCGVCLERLGPPILQCVNGHGVCKKCQRDAKVCPTCNQGILTNKPILLTQILEKLPQMCRFADKGCKDLSFSGDHESVCSYRPYNCPVADCGWAGAVWGLKKHWQSQHPNSIHTYSLKDQSPILYQKFKDNDGWQTLHIVDNNLFIIQAEKDNNTKRFLQWVTFVPTRKYKYDYYFSTSFSDGKNIVFKYTHKAESFSDEDEEYRDESPQCMILPLDVLKRTVTLEDDCLRGTVDITRVEIVAEQ